MRRKEAAMKKNKTNRAFICLLLTALISVCSSCGSQSQNDVTNQQFEPKKYEISDFLVAVEDEPDTVDFQCTSIYYTIAQNVFNRLVEMENDENGNMVILPSLAKSWEISDGGRRYTFHLQEDVEFSNGKPLTASDVQFTFERLLTHPDSCNKDIVDIIVGSAALENGETDHLEGFKVLSDLDFEITIQQPFEAFLACLTMPGASILDEESVTAAGNLFGKDPKWTIGTGSFVLRKWTPGEGMLLTANQRCWMGVPNCEGLDLRFVNDAREIRRMFENGEIDVLDLDEVGNSAEFFLHGQEYQDRLFHVPRIGITYIAMNESIEPLNDVRVRKAMQMSLDRSTILSAIYGARGNVENGIFPHGLYGYNPDLPEIPYDPDMAKELLADAGYKNGFELTVSVNSSSTQWELSVLEMAASMWGAVGIKTKVVVIDESEFMRRRKGGELACYTAQWMADFNDPDNFIYTFYGNEHNTTFRSLCYPKQEVMTRVQKARTITDPKQRISEYQDLERIIVQEDAAWIPLFSRTRYYVTSERLQGIQASWNGSVKNKYREMSIITVDE